MTRRKFKAKVAIEALKERDSLTVLAQKYELLPQQITNWKREFLEGSESVFQGKVKSTKTGSPILKSMILMDGMDLMQVLEGRVPLKDMILIKRRHASQTGDIYYQMRYGRG
ncbi:MAG: transposase [Crocinitomicaceae bacterium]|jgi:transposase